MMKKNSCRRVLAGALAVAFVSMNLPASVAGELRAVAVQPGAAQELTAFSDQVNALVSQDTPDAYYDTLTIKAGQNAAIADGETVSLGAAAKMENGVLTVSEQFLNEMMGIKSENGNSAQSLKRVPLKETAEAMGYTVIMTEDGAELKNNFQTARLIVKAKGKIDSLGADDVIDGYNDLHILQYETPAEAFAAYQAYQEMDNVEYVEPSVYVQSAAADTTSNVKQVAKDLVNRAQSSTSSISGDHYSWGAETLCVDTYTNFLSTSVEELPEIVVAVIDTGIDYSHEWFADRIVGGANFVDNGNALPQDDHGHGTHVSGTICDMTLDNVKILPVKALAADGSGSSEQIYCAMAYANESGAEVINMSLGGYGYSYLFDEAVKEGTEKGIIYCIAAGNDSMSVDLFSPGNIEEAITVSAVDSYDEIAYFTNFGSFIDLAAPGVMIDSAAVGGGTVSMDGTSMATPHVAGCCALLKSYDPTLNADQALAILANNAVDLGEPGYDELFGYGRISMDFTDMYTERCAVPEFSVAGGAYEGAQTLTITAEEDSTIYYTTDNTEPSAENGTLYTEPIEITASMVVRAVAVCEGKGDSRVVTERYIIDGLDTANALQIVDGVLVQYNGVMSVLNLAELEEAKSITAIGPSAFVGSNVSVLTLPDSVTEIQDCAFENCKTLTEINAPGVTVVGDYAFSGCTSLEETEFGVLEEAGMYSFANSSITSLNISALTELPEGIFRNCVNLYEIIADNVTVVGDNALENCGFEIADCLAMEKLTSIGSYAFSGCYALGGEISFDSLTTIGEYALANTGVTSVSFPETITELPAGVLYSTYMLEAVSAPGATVIGDPCFANEDIFSDQIDFEIDWTKVTSIGTTAFAFQSFDEDVVLSSLTSIGEGAFLICSFATVSIPNMTKLTPCAMLGSTAESVVLESIESFTMDDVPMATYYVIGSSCVEILPATLMEELMESPTDFNCTFVGEADSYVQQFAEENGYTFEEAPFVAEIDAYQSGYQFDTIVLKANVLGFGLTYQWYESDSENGEGTAIAGATSSSYKVPTEKAGTKYYWCEVATGDEIVTTDVYQVEVWEYDSIELTEGVPYDLIDTEQAAFLFTPETDGLYGFPYTNAGVYVTVIGKDMRTDLYSDEYLQLTGGETYMFLVDCSESPEFNRFVIRSEANAVQSMYDTWIDLETWQFNYVPGETYVPEFTVYDDYSGDALVEGVDYEVYCFNNDKPGVATLHVCGIGAYEGTRITAFSIIETLELDEIKPVEMLKSDTMVFVYTAEKSGTYTLSSGYEKGFDYNSGEVDCFVSVYSETEYIGEFDDTENSLMFEGEIEMVAGETYTFEVSCWAFGDDDGVAVFNIRLTDDSRTSLKDAYVYAENAEYTGEVVVPTVYVELDGVVLEENVDYIVIPDMLTLSGWGEARISGIGNYYGVVDYISYKIGSAAASYEIHGTLTENETTVLDWANGPVLNYMFNPTACTNYRFTFDSFDVCYSVYTVYEEDGETVYDCLSDSIWADYYYFDSDQTYMIQFTSFSEEATNELYIEPTLMIEDADVTVGNYYYNGEPIEPEITVEYNGELLVEDTDYSLYCDIAEAPGYYDYSIYGIGRFSGELSGYYVVGYEVDTEAPVLEKGINKIEINEAGAVMNYQFTADSDSEYLFSAEMMGGIRIGVYNAAGMVEVDPTMEASYLYLSQSVYFEEGETYYISLSLADPSMTGSFDLLLTDVCADIIMVDIDYNPVVTYTGELVVPEFTLSYEGETLVEGVDYAIMEVFDGVECGTHQVLIRGLGNFGGYVNVTYAIVPESMEVNNVVELVIDDVTDIEMEYGVGTLCSLTADAAGTYSVYADSYSNMVNVVLYDADMNAMPFDGYLDLEEGETVYFYLTAYEVLGLDVPSAMVNVEYNGDYGYGDGEFIYEYDEETGGVIIVGYNNYSDEPLTVLEIPEEIDGMPVLGIGDYAFAGCSDLMNVILPPTPALEEYGFYIGEGAFLATALTDVFIPDNYFLGEYCFGYDENGELVEGFVIMGYTNTAAEEYAEANGIEFWAMRDFGDVNNDGLVDTDDAALILKTYANLMVSGGEAPEDYLIYGDIDGNGELNSDDAVAILKVYANYLVTGEYDWSIISVG